MLRTFYSELFEGLDTCQRLQQNESDPINTVIAYRKMLTLVMDQVESMADNEEHQALTKDEVLEYTREAMNAILKDL